MENIKELKELIIYACENWLREHIAPNDWMPLSREAIEDLLRVLKSNI